jgi:hypothetical protein
VHCDGVEDRLVRLLVPTSNEIRHDDDYCSLNASKRYVLLAAGG